MYHTAYNSYESCPGGRDYIGKHSAETPYDDYKGSFTDPDFDPDSRITMAYSKTAEGAQWFEINFHNVFDVARDPQFANRAKQTAKRFDRTGVPNTPEHNKRISDAQKGLQAGEKNPNYGKPRKTETKQKIRDSKIGIPMSEEARKNMSESHIGLMSGENSPFNKKVIVTYPEGRVEKFPSVVDASNSLGHDSSALAKMCRKNGTFLKGKLKGCSFRYLGDSE